MIDEPFQFFLVLQSMGGLHNKICDVSRSNLILNKLGVLNIEDMMKLEIAKFCICPNHCDAISTLVKLRSLSS